MSQTSSKPVSFGNPAALGLGAFALTTFVLSVFNAGGPAISGGEGVVLGLALFYGGIAQLIAGIWEFANRNTFAAVTFISYGAFWMSFWFLVFVQKGAPLYGTALYLTAWFVMTCILTVASFNTNVVTVIVFCVLVVTFFFLALGSYVGVGDPEAGTALNMVGGWLGICTAIAAWYGCFAVVVNETFKKLVIPVGILHNGRVVRHPEG